MITRLPLRGLKHGSPIHKLFYARKGLVFTEVAYTTSTVVEPVSVPKSPVLLPMLEPPGSQMMDVDERAGRLLKLLADSTRRRIFLALLGGETCNCELADAFGLAENLISHHIRQLREAGFVRERRDADDARWIYYSVNVDAYRAAWLALCASLDPSLIGTRSPVCDAPELK